MDKSIERIILRALEDARVRGRDHLAQTELAVRAVCEARPDMTASDALAAVNRLRRSWRGDTGFCRQERTFRELTLEVRI